MIRTILLFLVILFGMVAMLFWYEIFTRNEFERTFYFLKNIPPMAIRENKEAFRVITDMMNSKFIEEHSE